MKSKVLRILALTFIVGVFTSCRVGTVTSSGGMDSQSYLQFIQGGERSYSGGVTVYIDQNTEFPAKVDRVRKFGGTRGNLYGIQPGKRHLKVVYKNNILYEKDIVVATQETKKITLP